MCYRLLWLCSDDSNWFSRQCMNKINIRPNMRLCSVHLKSGLWRHVPVHTGMYRHVLFYSTSRYVLTWVWRKVVHTGMYRYVLKCAKLAQVMDAGCGSSTRGHWDGPVTCNKSHGIAARELAGRKVPCEHDASPCLGHATVCSGCALTILIGSLSSASAR